MQTPPHAPAILLAALLMPLAPSHAAAGKLVELTGDGGWGYAGPHAVIANDTLFFSYLDGSGGKWVASYEFPSGDIHRSQVGKAPPNLHAANPLMIRPDGRIQMFIEKGGYYDKRIRWRVSAQPWLVAEFGELQESELEGDIIQGRQFYPMVHRSTGEVYLMINAKRNEGNRREAVMWRSLDGGIPGPSTTRCGGWEKA